MGNRFDNCWLCRFMALSWLNLPCALKPAIGKESGRCGHPASLPLHRGLRQGAYCGSGSPPLNTRATSAHRPLRPCRRPSAAVPEAVLVCHKPPPLPLRPQAHRLPPLDPVDPDASRRARGGAMSGFSGDHYRALRLLGSYPLRPGMYEFSVDLKRLFGSLDRTP
jgi:hypothetical protein